MTSTDLRKQLFQTLDKTVQGQTFMIVYKGKRVKIAAEAGASKLGRAVRRNAIVGNPDALVASDAELMAELEAKWQAEDGAL